MMKKNKYLPFLCLLIFTGNLSMLTAQQQPQAGEILITEFMVNPSAVSDTKGEWIELHNPGTQDLVMNNLLLSDLGSNNHLIETDTDWILPAGGFIILARNADPAENGGITPDYVYRNFTLGNSADEIILINPTGDIIDAVHYTSDWPIYAGASMELDPGVTDTLANNEASNWHPGVDIYGSGDLGTPGEINSFSSGIAFDHPEVCIDAYPNPCSDLLHIRFPERAPGSVQIGLINLLGQKIPVVSSSNNPTANFSIDMSVYDRGMYWLEIQSDFGQQAIKVIKN